MGVLDPARTTLIRSGIDLDPFRELRSAALRGGEERKRLRHRARGRFGVPHDTSVVTMVAGLRPQKAPVDFVEVAARVIRRIETPVRFWLVGDGELRESVERRRRELDIEYRVEILGFRDDVPELLAATDVAVLTSRWEGLPRVVPEAMAAGLPVVANDVCGVSEAVREGESGWLVRPGDVDGMADRVVALLEDPSRAAAMGSRAASLCEEFDIRRMMRSQEELYERLGARSGAAIGRPAPAGGASARSAGG
jgi:glycosyltransferase involved in cell wall biosynthesis